MSEEKTPISKDPDFKVVLRGNIVASIIIGSSDFRKNRWMVYYIHSDGKLFLRDRTDNVGSRNINVHKGDIVCLHTDKETGFEKLCSYLNKKGDRIAGDYDLEFPSRIRTSVREWCKKNLDHRSRL